MISGTAATVDMVGTAVEKNTLCGKKYTVKSWKKVGLTHLPTMSFGWGSAFQRMPEEGKDAVLFEHLPAILSSSHGTFELHVWSRIQSWPPARQCELFLKFVIAISPRALALIKLWPLDVQLHYFVNGGQATESVAPGWPHDIQQAYYDHVPPQYEAAVDKAVLADERRFRLKKGVPLCPKVLATRAYFMAGYIVPDFAPAVCGDAPAGIALAIGFEVYSTFHGVHAHMKNEWFSAIMRAVIARMLK
jgi:hypothetical protein